VSCDRPPTWECDWMAMSFGRVRFFQSDFCCEVSESLSVGRNFSFFRRCFFFRLLSGS